MGLNIDGCSSEDILYLDFENKKIIKANHIGKMNEEEIILSEEKKEEIFVLYEKRPRLSEEYFHYIGFNRQMGINITEEEDSYYLGVCRIYLKTQDVDFKWAEIYMNQDEKVDYVFKLDDTYAFLTSCSYGYFSWNCNYGDEKQDIIYLEKRGQVLILNPEHRETEQAVYLAKWENDVWLALIFGDEYGNTISYDRAMQAIKQNAELNEILTNGTSLSDMPNYRGKDEFVEIYMNLFENK